MPNWFQFEISVKLGRWKIELSRDDGFLGLWLGLLRYAENGTSCYPRWQWAIERLRRPVIMRRDQMPRIEFVGARIVPCEVVEDDKWDEVIDA